MNATNHSVGSTYQLADNEPHQGNNYFRLKSVDRNGSFVYSDIKLVQMKNKVEAYTLIYPNPADGKVTIQGHSDSHEEIRLQVIDFSGKQIMFKRLGIQNIGPFATTIDLSTLAKGIYQINILINKEKYVNKVILY